MLIGRGYSLAIVVFTECCECNDGCDRVDQHGGEEGPQEHVVPHLCGHIIK